MWWSVWVDDVVGISGDSDCRRWGRACDEVVNGATRLVATRWGVVRQEAVERRHGGVDRTVCMVSTVHQGGSKEVWVFAATDPSRMERGVREVGEGGGEAR
jgi:hypothetical protein